MLRTDRGSNVVRKASRRERPCRDDDWPLRWNPVNHFMNHFDKWMRLDPARDFRAELLTVDSKRPTCGHAMKLPDLHG